jgi:hypothetical protein
VNYVFAVRVCNKVQQRAHNANCVLLTELTARNNLVKQLAAAAQLHDLHTTHGWMQSIT